MSSRGRGGAVQRCQTCGHTPSLREISLSLREDVLATREKSMASWDQELKLEEADLDKRAVTLAQRESSLDARELAVKRREQDAQQEFQEKLKQVEKLKMQLEKDAKRRANRTNSDAFIEDIFPALTPVKLIQLLDNDSVKIRKTTLHTLIPAIVGGDLEIPGRHPAVKNLAPVLIPTLLPLLSADEPRREVLEFASTALSNSNMAMELGRTAQLSILLDLLSHSNPRIKSSAETALRVIFQPGLPLDPRLQDTLLLKLPTLPELAAGLVAAVTPAIVTSNIQHKHYVKLLPVLSHDNAAIRNAAFPTLFNLIRADATHQQGLVDAGLLIALDKFIRLASPPPDIVAFIQRFLAEAAPVIVRQNNAVRLCSLLSHPLPRISQAAATGIRASILSDDGKLALIKAKIVAKYVQILSGNPSPHLTALINETIPMLSVQLVRSGACQALIDLLDDQYPEDTRNSAITALVQIASSEQDRKSVQDVILLHLLVDQVRAPILRLALLTLPLLAPDLAQATNVPKLIALLQHPEPLLRASVVPVVLDLIRSSAPSRQALVQHGGFRGILVTPKSLDDADHVSFVFTALPLLALDLAAAHALPEIFELLHHSDSTIRKAAQMAILRVAEGSISDQSSLVSSGILGRVAELLDSPAEVVNDMSAFASTVITKLAPVFATSRVDCSRLLLLIDSSLEAVRTAASMALRTILRGQTREPLTEAILASLDSDSPAICDFVASALPDGLCEDIAEDRNYLLLYPLLSHSDPRIRTASISALQDAIRRTKLARRALVDSDFHIKLLQLLQSPTLDILEFATTCALPGLAKTLASQGKCYVLLDLLSFGDARVRLGAIAALKSVAEGTDIERLAIVNAGILARLGTLLETPDEDIVEFSVVVIPQLAECLAQSGEIPRMMDLLKHKQDQVASCCLRALTAMAGKQNTVQQEKLAQSLLSRIHTSQKYELSFCCQVLPSLGAQICEIGESRALCALLWHEDKDITYSATAALHSILKSGTDKQRKRLVHADLFDDLRRLFQQAQFQELICIAITTSVHLVIEAGQVKQLVPLFRAIRPEIRTTLHQTLWGLCRRENYARELVQHDVLPALLGYEGDDQVAELIAFMCTKLANKFFAADRSRDLANLLGHPELKIALAATRAIQEIVSTQEQSKDVLMETNSFIDGLKQILQSRDPDLRLLASDIVMQMCYQNAVRTKRILEEGFCDVLVTSLAQQDIDTKIQALETLNTITSVSLMNSRSVFSFELLVELSRSFSLNSSVLQKQALQVAQNIATQQPQRLSQDAAGRNLATSIVQCLHLQDVPILISALTFCHAIAGQSDQERHLLVKVGIINALPGVVGNQQADVVILACSVVEQLSMNPTIRRSLIDYGTKKALSQVSGLFTKSKLRVGEDKQGVKRAAEAALATLT